MKEICEKCPLQDKTETACLKRKCPHSGYVEPKDEKAELSFPMIVGETIDAKGFKLLVTHIDYDGGFNAQISDLLHLSTEHGSYGSYITEGRHYHFMAIDNGLNRYEPSMTWEIPAIGTERFHREGTVGADLLLFWNKEEGFTADLDS